MPAFTLQASFLAVSLLATADSAANVDQVLSLLERDLAFARQGTPGTPTSCPDSLGDLLGASLEQVQSRIGPGDITDHGLDSSGAGISVHQYLFAEPSAQWLGLAPSAGVGTAVTFAPLPFTVLRLVYDPNGQVASAVCYVARGA